MFKEIVKEALSTGERRLIAISGKDSLELASELVDIWLSMREGRVLVVTNMSTNLDRVSISERDLTSIDFDQTEEVLGGTWDLLIADLSSQFRANDLGRLVEVVRG
ncbi:MAG: DUF1726 domain-containing protein, partial [Candidatus Korarchaeum sp.]|nr:DUF1726 domain-containing protein [Candidatus Korarchaeum sp.]MDW8035555.1 DUF1726 domain-containing protein [Candidatus Korarchaeum sp.]